jgi:hypothetical protein
MDGAKSERGLSLPSGRNESKANPPPNTSQTEDVRLFARRFDTKADAVLFYKQKQSLKKRDPNSDSRRVLPSLSAVLSEMQTKTEAKRLEVNERTLVHSQSNDLICSIASLRSRTAKAKIDPDLKGSGPAFQTRARTKLPKSTTKAKSKPKRGKPQTAIPSTSSNAVPLGQKQTKRAHISEAKEDNLLPLLPSTNALRPSPPSSSSSSSRSAKSAFSPAKTNSHTPPTVAQRLADPASRSISTDVRNFDERPIKHLPNVSTDTEVDEAQKRGVHWPPHEADCANVLAFDASLPPSSVGLSNSTNASEDDQSTSLPASSLSTDRNESEASIAAPEPHRRNFSMQTEEEVFSSSDEEKVCDVETPDSSVHPLPATTKSRLNVASNITSVPSSSTTSTVVENHPSLVTKPPKKKYRKRGKVTNRSDKTESCLPPVVFPLPFRAVAPPATDSNPTISSQGLNTLATPFVPSSPPPDIPIFRHKQQTPILVDTQTKAPILPRSVSPPPPFVSTNETASESPNNSDLFPRSETVDEIRIFGKIIRNGHISLDDFRAAQKADVEIGKILSRLSKGEKVPPYQLTDDILFRIGGRSQARPYLPFIFVHAECWKEHYAYEGIHASPIQVATKIGSRYYHPQLLKWTKQYILACPICAVSVRSKKIPYEISEMYRNTVPRMTWICDLFHGIPRTSTGYTCVLLCVDHASNFVVARRLRSKDTATLIETFKHDIFPFTLPPLYVRSDNEAGMTADQFQYILSALGIEHHASASVRPHTNGQVEVVVAKVKALLRKVGAMTGHDAEEWSEVLPTIVNCVNRTKGCYGFTPEIILFGNEIPSKDRLLTFREPNATMSSTEEIEMHLENVFTIRTEMKERRLLKQEEVRISANKRRRSRVFLEGELVYCDDSTIKAHGTLRATKTGPHRITKVADHGHSVMIQNLGDDSTRKVHVGALSHIVQHPPSILTSQWATKLDAHLKLLKSQGKLSLYDERLLQSDDLRNRPSTSERPVDPEVASFVHEATTPD